MATEIFVKIEENVESYRVRKGEAQCIESYGNLCSVPYPSLSNIFCKRTLDSTSGNYQVKTKLTKRAIFVM